MGTVSILLFIPSFSSLQLFTLPINYAWAKENGQPIHTLGPNTPLSNQYLIIYLIVFDLEWLFQALPLVSTFWGILLFGEYRRSSKKTYALLISMLFMFMVAVGVLMASSGHRNESSVAKFKSKQNELKVSLVTGKVWLNWL